MGVRDHPVNRLCFSAGPRRGGRVVLEIKAQELCRGIQELRQDILQVVARQFDILGACRDFLE